MKKEFFRTEKTELSDDELILFDAFFDLSCPVKFLKRKGFRERFNFEYKHDLNNEELELCLKGLQARKLIKVNKLKGSGATDGSVSLLAKGGKLWEKEREPVWEKYCEGWTYSPAKKENKLLMEVISPSLKTLKKYLEVSKELNLNGFTEKHKTTFVVERRKSIVGLSWKRFEEIHTATIEGEYNSAIDVDVNWNIYYKKLDWWGTVHELKILSENSYEQ